MPRPFPDALTNKHPSLLQGCSFPLSMPPLTACAMAEILEEPSSSLALSVVVSTSQVDRPAQYRAIAVRFLRDCGRHEGACRG